MASLAEEDGSANESFEATETQLDHFNMFNPFEQAKNVSIDEQFS